MVSIKIKNIEHMKCLKDLYSDPFYSYYTPMIFLTHLTYCFKYYLQMTQLEKVDNWLKSNKLTVHINKTHYMLFHRTKIKHRVPEDKSTYIRETNLVCANTTNCLGVIIDSKLNGSHHITHVKNKILKYIGILTKINTQ